MSLWSLHLKCAYCHGCLGYHEIRVLIDVLLMMMVFVLCIDAIFYVKLCFSYKL
jgi:hypothetical protein